MTTLTLTRSELKTALPRKHHLVRVNSAAGAHRVAIRAGLSIAISLVVLWLTGHLSWAIYAAFGSFTSVYGRSETHQARLRMQLQAGASLVLGVTAGTAVGCFADRDWLAVPVVAAVAFAGSLAADRLRWHPGGPLFIVFGTAAVGARAVTPGQIPLAFAIAGSAALLAVAIGTAGRLRGVFLPAPPTAAPVSVQPPSGWHWAQAARYGAAVLAAGAAATALGIGHPYWSMVAAVVAVTGPDTAARLTRAVHRIAGTLVGVLLGAAILTLHLPVAAIIVVIAVLQSVTELMVGRNYALAVVFLTPLALVMGALAQPTSTLTLVNDRAIETVLGAAIGIVISLAAHQVPTRSASATAAAR